MEAPSVNVEAVAPNIAENAGEVGMDAQSVNDEGSVVNNPLVLLVLEIESCSNTGELVSHHDLGSSPDSRKERRRFLGDQHGTTR